ncbi:MAG: hypothetical protein K6E79_00955 [Pseudobutyrivibrio sp.]|nr:hypothetical protein [Pseudobutyrivibrio sp.]
MIADERIINLINKEYLDRIPSFVKNHATGKTCQLIAREYPDLYGIFSREQEPTNEENHQMQDIVNDIVAKRLDKQHL